MTGALGLSVVILTKNEAGHIEQTLGAFKDVPDVIIIDDGSTDGTKNLVKRALPGCSLYEYKNPSFSKKRNFGIEKARNPWVLFVDADEEVSEKLLQEIYKAIKNSQHDAYRLKRIDEFWGKKLLWGEVWEARTKGIVRLVKKGTGEWQGEVHERWATKSTIGTLGTPLIHKPHPTIKEFLQSVNSYSSLRAKELAAQKKVKPHEMVTYPLAKFLVSYIFLLGFLDGPAGFVYSFMMAFHSFLTRSKALQLQQIIPAP